MERVKQAQAGDAEAFSLLIADEQDKVYRMIFAYVRKEDDAVDVYQQTVMSAYENLHKLTEPAYFSTWLVRIAINKSLTYIKKRDREQAVSPETLYLLEADTVPIAENLDLWQALQTLNDTYKTALLLRYYSDYTIAQIADITEQPLGTVKTQIRRGLRALRKQLTGEAYYEFAQADDE